MLLGSSGCMPEMLLNTLQCPGPLSTTWNYPDPNVDNVEVEIPCCIG